MTYRFISFSRKTYKCIEKLYGLTIERIPFTRSLVRGAGGLILSLLEKTRGMALPPDDYWGFGTKLRFLMGWYEFETVGVCRRLLRPGMNVLDIGAHCGYYTRLFSHLVGPEGRVYAFEPHPETFRFLSRNVSSAKHRNIFLIQKAVSDQPGEKEFFEMTGTGKHSLYNVSYYLPHITLKQKIFVECITVDSFIAEQGNPEINFIKMDIEGAELSALAGMSKTIARSKNLAMIVEFGPGTLKGAGVEPDEFLNYLFGMGFKIEVIEPAGRLTPFHKFVYPDGLAWHVNLLCSKTS